MRTFIAIDVGILDDDGPAVQCRVLLGLALCCSNVPNVFRACAWRETSRHADYIARQEVLGNGKVCVGSGGFTVAALQ